MRAMIMVRFDAKHKLLLLSLFAVRLSLSLFPSQSTGITDGTGTDSPYCVF